MKNIIYVGQFTDISGYGNAARKFLKMLDKHLDKKKYCLKVYNSSQENGIFCSEDDYDLIKKYQLKNENVDQFITKNEYTVVFHTLPPDAFLNNRKNKNFFIHKNAKEKINMSYWEADRLPLKWRQIFSHNLYDKVILGCEWNKEIYLKDVKKPICVIPLPFKNKQKIEKKRNKEFTIFSLSQWQPRKGFDILIKAFCQEFFNNSDVKLVIKTYKNEVLNSTDSQIVANEAMQYKSSCSHYLEDGADNKIDIVLGFLNEDQIKELYATADVFCLTSRGEGFSIPTAEAALNTIPCIVPNSGGHIDFLDKKNNIFFDCYPKPIENMGKNELYSSCEMNFLEPDILSVRKSLRSAYNMWKEDPTKLEKMGLQARKTAEAFLDYKVIYQKFIDFVDS